MPDRQDSPSSTSGFARVDQSYNNNSQNPQQRRLQMNCGVFQVGVQGFEAKLHYQGVPSAVQTELDSASFRSHGSGATSKLWQNNYVHIAYRRVKWRGTTLVVTLFSDSSFHLRPLNTATVTIKPYLHLQYKAAQDTSPPSNRFPILPEAVRDRASIHHIGPCFRLWP